MLPLFFIGVALCLLLRKMALRTHHIECDPAWLEDFSITKYRPMLRLLAEDDYDFLASQAGYQGKIASELRAERRKVFRSYLRSLVRDFNRMHQLGRMMAAHAAQDRSEFTKQLLKQRVTFTMAVAAVRVRLMLHTVGIGVVDVRNLIGSLDHMRSNVEPLMPETSSAA